MWVNAAGARFSIRVGSGLLAPRKQLCPLVLEAAPKSAMHGAQQVSRNAKSARRRAFLSSDRVFEDRFYVGIAARPPEPTCTALCSGDDFPTADARRFPHRACLRFHSQGQGRSVRPMLAPPDLTAVWTVLRAVSGRWCDTIDNWRRCCCGNECVAGGSRRRACLLAGCGAGRGPKWLRVVVSDSLWGFVG